MRTMLRVDSSARHEGSHTRSLADYFHRAWLKLHPHGIVIERDLAENPPPHLDQATISEFGAAVGASDATALSDELIAELKSADDVVISSPLYNLGIPSTLKAYIDNVVRSGHTFEYGEEGMTGLLSSTNAYLLLSRGGEAVPGVADDFQTPHLQAILGFLGIGPVETISLDGTAGDPEEVERRTRAAREKIDHLLAPCDTHWVGQFTAEDRREIAALRDAQAEAIAAGDAERYTGLCADDVQLMLPGHGITSGRPAFLEVESKLLKGSPCGSFIKCPQRVELHGNLAVETGLQRVVQRSNGNGSAVFLPNQKYTHVLRRTAEGWRFAVLMSNSCE